MTNDLTTSNPDHSTILSRGSFTNLPHNEQIVSTEELEQLTGLSKRFWESRRISGDSPPFIRLSARAIRYKWGAVQTWLNNRIVKSTSDFGGAENV